MARHLINNFIVKSDTWNDGEQYITSLDLQRLGVLEGAGGVGGPEWNITINGEGHAVVKGKAWTLLIRGEPGTKLTFAVLLLTRMGQEVMSLLNVADEANNMRVLSDHLSKTNVVSVELGSLIPAPNGIAQFVPVELLWTKPEDEAVSVQ